MEVTAYDAFYNAIEKFNLPASIPVVNEDGDIGLATQSIDFLENEEAFQMFFSEDKMERAKAAIYACEHTPPIHHGLPPRVGNTHRQEV